MPQDGLITCEQSHKYLLKKYISLDRKTLAQVCCNLTYSPNVGLSVRGWAIDDDGGTEGKNGWPSGNLHFTYPERAYIT